MISGPISVGLVGLTPGVTLNNSNGTFNGAPFITVTGNTMNPGDSANGPDGVFEPVELENHFQPHDSDGLIAARECDEGLAEAGGEGFVSGEFEEQVGDGGALLGGVGFMFHSGSSVARGRTDGASRSL